MELLYMRRFWQFATNHELIRLAVHKEILVISLAVFNWEDIRQQHSAWLPRTDGAQFAVQAGWPTCHVSEISTIFTLRRLVMDLGVHFKMVLPYWQFLLRRDTLGCRVPRWSDLNSSWCGFQLPFNHDERLHYMPRHLCFIRRLLPALLSVDLSL